MPDLTLDEINRLRALEKAATPGEWTADDALIGHVVDGRGHVVAFAYSTPGMDGRSLTKRQSDQAEAIAALRNAAPALLDMAAECLRLRDRHALAADLLHRVVIKRGSGEWSESEMRRWACDFKDWRQGLGLDLVQSMGHRNCVHEGGGKHEGSDA